MNVQSPTCSCGDAKPHVVAVRQTSDGVRLTLWSDGDVTRRGIALRGLGRARTPFAAECYVRALSDIAGDIERYDAAEVATAIRIARRERMRTRRPINDADRRVRLRALVACTLDHRTEPSSTDLETRKSRCPLATVE